MTMLPQSFSASLYASIAPWRKCDVAKPDFGHPLFDESGTCRVCRRTRAKRLFDAHRASALAGIGQSCPCCRVQITADSAIPDIAAFRQAAKQFAEPLPAGR